MCTHTHTHAHILCSSALPVSHMLYKKQTCCFRITQHVKFLYICPNIVLNMTKYYTTYEEKIDKIRHILHNKWQQLEIRQHMTKNSVHYSTTQYTPYTCGRTIENRKWWPPQPSGRAWLSLAGVPPCGLPSVPPGWMLPLSTGLWEDSRRAEFELATFMVLWALIRPVSYRSIFMLRT